MIKVLPQCEPHRINALISAHSLLAYGQSLETLLKPGPEHISVYSFVDSWFKRSLMEMIHKVIQFPKPPTVFTYEFGGEAPHIHDFDITWS
jgi:hypothetical protein